MQFYRRWSGRTLVFAGLTTALAMGIIGSCSRKIIMQSRVAALDARAQPYFNKARSNVPCVVRKLTTVGSLCRICWYMPRDKLTGSHKAQEYLSSVMKEPIMEPCRQGAQIYGCKLDSAGFLKSLKEINADYAVTKAYAVGGLALEAFFLKYTIAALGRVMSAAAVRLSAAYGGGTVCALADGPFPFGDAVGVIIATAGTLWSIYDLCKARSQLPKELTAALQQIITDCQQSNQSKICARECCFGQFFKLAVSYIFTITPFPFSSKIFSEDSDIKQP